MPRHVLFVAFAFLNFSIDIIFARSFARSFGGMSLLKKRGDLMFGRGKLTQLYIALIYQLNIIYRF